MPEVGADLAPGDLVLMYTDGVTDARAANGERFDEWRLLDAVESVRGGSAQEVVDAVSGASWAMANRGDGTFDRWLLFGSTAPQYVTWFCGTAVLWAVGGFQGPVEPADDITIVAIRRLPLAA